MNRVVREPYKRRTAFIRQIIFGSLYNVIIKMFWSKLDIFWIKWLNIGKNISTFLQSIDHHPRPNLQKFLFAEFSVTTITYPSTLLLSYVKLLIIMYTDFLYSWWKNMQAWQNIFKLSGGMSEVYILGGICPLD